MIQELWAARDKIVKKEKKISWDATKSRVKEVWSLAGVEAEVTLGIVPAKHEHLNTRNQAPQKCPVPLWRSSNQPLLEMKQEPLTHRTTLRILAFNWFKLRKFYGTGTLDVQRTMDRPGKALNPLQL
ncbi:hypothetical protein PABG_06852 [Paracoccidioides brasiliensis Pb03]|nr:hypothetical protein PABG_06852 [Paracoccidioides brasiliensis Pb03]